MARQRPVAVASDIRKRRIGKKDCMTKFRLIEREIDEVSKDLYAVKQKITALKRKRISLAQELMNNLRERYPAKYRLLMEKQRTQNIVALRAQIAIYLTSQGYTSGEVASLLNIDRGSISHYLNSHRFSDTDPETDAILSYLKNLFVV